MIQKIKVPKLVSGFTLIELLVVIAIIGILAAVILSSVNIARDKAANAAIKSDLKSARNQIEIFYDTNSTYVNVCTDPNVVPSLEGAALAATGLNTDYECNSDSVSWAIETPLKVADSDGSTYWCLDNQGSTKGEVALLAGALGCP